MKNIVYQCDWNEGFIAAPHGPTWSVWRKDENGNVFLVQNNLAEIEALRLVRDYEGKGHKQTYWAKENL